MLFQYFTIFFYQQSLNKTVVVVVLVPLKRSTFPTFSLNSLVLGMEYKGQHHQQPVPCLCLCAFGVFLSHRAHQGKAHSFPVAGVWSFLTQHFGVPSGTPGTDTNTHTHGHNNNIAAMRRRARAFFCVSDNLLGRFRSAIFVCGTCAACGHCWARFAASGKCARDVTSSATSSSSWHIVARATDMRALWVWSSSVRCLCIGAIVVAFVGIGCSS